MKNKKIITALTALLSLSVAFQAKEDSAEKDYKDYENIWKPLNPDKKSKKSNVRLKKFTPDDAFGGNNAQGKYNQKEQTATIKNNETTYECKVLDHTRNPVIPEKFNNDEDVVIIGFFSTINKKKPEMPITTYLFGTVEKTTPN